VQVSPSHPINHGDWTPQPVTLIPPFATPCVLVSNVLNGVIKVAHNCDVQAVLLPEEYRNCDVQAVLLPEEYRLFKN
jgi:hypothetical protein